MDLTWICLPPRLPLDSEIFELPTSHDRHHLHPVLLPLPTVFAFFTCALAFFHVITLLAPGLHHPASAPSLALHFPSFFRTSAPVTLFPSHTLPLSLSSLLLSLHHFSHPLLVHLAPPLLRPAADFTWHLSFLATSSHGSSIPPLSPLPLLSSSVQKTHTPDRTSLPQAACTGHS